MNHLIKSTDTIQMAINLVGQLRELLSGGEFQLTKWYSNKRAKAGFPLLNFFARSNFSLLSKLN